MQLVPIPTSDIQSSSDIHSPATLLHFETSKKKKKKNTTFEDDYSDSLCLKPKLCFRLSFSYHGFLEASSVPGLGQRNATLEKGRLALQM